MRLTQTELYAFTFMISIYMLIQLYEYLFENPMFLNNIID